MALEWWLTKSGDNLLQGVPGDATNPPLLTDDMIVEFLMQIPESRASFDRLVPNMLPEEQARLAILTEGAVSLTPLLRDTIADNFQHRFNTSGIRRGGGWAPPPFKE